MTTAAKHTDTTHHTQQCGRGIPARCQDELERCVASSRRVGSHSPCCVPRATVDAMRLTSSGAYARPPPVPTMPTGLVELMEDLTRNVLRHNPANVYEFCAGHMEKLLEIRDGRALKQVLPLDQKIARVQEKMNKKAELRRQKYDMQIKLYRLNSKLEQTSGSMKPSNVVKDTANSPETHFSQVHEIKQKITSIPEENLSAHSNKVEDQSKNSAEISHDQEINKKNYEKEFIQNKHVEENDTKESVKAEFEKDIDMNIGAEIKDSIEQHLGQDIEMQNNPEEMVTGNLIELERDEVENKTKNSIEKFEQGTETNQELEELASLNNEEIKTDFSQSAEDEPTKSMDNNSLKDVAISTGAGESVAANLVKNETNHLDVPENKKETESPLQEITEIKLVKDAFIGENVAQDPTAFANAVEDDSKGPIPVHHEQDLVDDLEVEIFHEPSESKNESKVESTNTEEFDEKTDNRTSVNIYEQDILQNEIENDKSNDEDQSSAKKDISFDQHDLYSSRKEGEKTKTNTGIDDSEIEIGNNKPNHNVSENSETSARSNENNLDVESKINYLSGSSSGNESKNRVAEDFVVKSKLDNENNIMTEEISSPAGKRANEPLENVVPEEKVNMKENVQDKLEISPSDNCVLEIPMQKKEYALLLPAISADDETEPTTLKGEIHVETVSLEKIDNKDENIILNEENNLSVEEPAGGIKEKGVVQSINNDINSRLDVQHIKNIDEPQEKNETVVDETEKEQDAGGNKTHHHLDSYTEINAKVKELNNENKEQELGKVFNDKHNATSTSHNDIKTELKTAKREETFDDADENTSSNSELTKKTETPFVNDSADESTVGDSNDSLIDHEVETRIEENNPTIMDLETAAITIQKVFRTFLFKSRCSTFEDTSTDEANPITDDENEKVSLRRKMYTLYVKYADQHSSACMLKKVTFQEELEYVINKERRALGISRMDTVLQTVNEEKSLSLSTDDSSTLSSAATVIQAHVRGFLTRNKFNSHKTISNASLVNSDGPSTQSFENDEQQKKTVLNIHIVPEGDHFLSRDESLITSMDLSLDGTPPSSVNLHPLGYDKSEPRKQLKREDAIQSISPPSNNSGKLSEDVESVKEMVINDIADPKVSRADTDMDSDSFPAKSNTLETVVEAIKGVEESSVSSEPDIVVQEADLQCKRALTKNNSDEGDVVTPFEQDRQSWIDSDQTSRLLHSGEFHDIVLPTKVTRSDTSVVRGE